MIYVSLFKLHTSQQYKSQDFKVVIPTIMIVEHDLFYLKCGHFNICGPWYSKLEQFKTQSIRTELHRLSIIQKLNSVKGNGYSQKKTDRDSFYNISWKT